MKRKEMEEIIRVTIERVLDIPDSHRYSIQCAEMVLNNIEQAGMLPPEVHNPDHCDCGNNYYTAYEWELEDKE